MHEVIRNACGVVFAVGMGIYVAVLAIGDQIPVGVGGLCLAGTSLCGFTYLAGWMVRRIVAEQLAAHNVETAANIEKSVNAALNGGVVQALIDHGLVKARNQGIVAEAQAQARNSGTVVQFGRDGDR